ncbi:MAG TPA: PEGA domain-containing protein [Terriglobales bacterium]|nr:PEGA domain-containing protein [Terriglobales bacterium]
MKIRIYFLNVVSLLLPVCIAAGQEGPKASAETEKARVFITDSQSWEMQGSSGGANGAFAGNVHGGARPQTAEIVKTFGERCPQVLTNNIQEKTDYVVVLDHEGGKGLLRHRNKVAVFNRVSGDSVVSKSTLSLGGSVQTACEAIEQDWSVHGPALRAAAAAAAQSKASPTPIAVPATPTPAATTAKVSVASMPDGADIEVDGSFVGNTPSDIEVGTGEHAVAVKKSGFKLWEKKLKVNAGSSVHLKAELEKNAN